MATLSRSQASTILRALGWRVRTGGEYTTALRNFQRGWNLGPTLAADGVLGPKTSAALKVSEAARRGGKGTASAHFSFAEFACKCGGRYAACERIKVTHQLLESLEVLRAKYGRAIRVVSGYRCPPHNKAVGGATSSQHMFGSACDLGYVAGWTAARVAALRIFSGLGFSQSTHLVRHVDRRDVSGHNTTSASTVRPTSWRYAS